MAEPMVELLYAVYFLLAFGIFVASIFTLE